MRFTNKQALVTGASSGIGLAVALALVGEGAQVIAADLAPLPVALPAAIHPVRLDVSSESDWQAAVAGIEGLDVVVASAGVADARPIGETSLEQWRRVMAVNLDGVFLTIRHTASLLKEGGSIVIIGSASGSKAAAGASAYGASKAAIAMLAKVAALELKDRGVRVNLVSPAGVATPMWTKAPFWKEMVEQQGGEEAAWKALGKADASTPALHRMAYPEEVARAVLFVASSDAAGMTGAELLVDAGYTV
jgi:NAD(P)-dependent dehydrogenase (short-subunit alcohol dehydrogenase family)